MSYNKNVRFPPGFGYLKQEDEGADGHHLEHDEEVDGHRGGERDLSLDKYQGPARGGYHGPAHGFGALGEGRGGGGSIGGFPGYQGREGGSMGGGGRGSYQGVADAPLVAGEEVRGT